MMMMMMMVIVIDEDEWGKRSNFFEVKKMEWRIPKEDDEVQSIIHEDSDETGMNLLCLCKEKSWVFFFVFFSLGEKKYPNKNFWLLFFFFLVIFDLTLLFLLFFSRVL